MYVLKQWWIIFQALHPLLEDGCLDNDEFEEHKKVPLMRLLTIWFGFLFLKLEKCVFLLYCNVTLVSFNVDEYSSKIEKCDPYLKSVIFSK